MTNVNKQNWQTKKLGEVLKLEYGKPLEKSERGTDGKYPVYGANGIKSRSNKFYYDKYSIVVGRKGSAGEINLTEEKFWPLDVTYFVTFDNKKYDLKFLYDLLETLELTKLARGVKPGINRNEVYNIDVKIPDIKEQRRIVKILNDVFGNIEKAKENAENNLQNSRDLFGSYLQNVFANPKKTWMKMRLKEACDKLLAGGDVPKNNFSKIKNEKYKIPIFANGFKKKGLFGYTDIEKVTVPSITISARGTIGYAEIRKEAFFPIVRLIVLTPNVKITDITFLYYMTHNFKFSNTGTSIPQLTIPMIENIEIPMPPIQEQKAIVKKLDALAGETKKLEAIYRQKLADLDELKKSVLKKAFNGEL